MIRKPKIPVRYANDISIGFTDLTYIGHTSPTSNWWHGLILGNGNAYYGNWDCDVKVGIHRERVSFFGTATVLSVYTLSGNAFGEVLRDRNI